LLLVHSSRESTSHPIDMAANPVIEELVNSAKDLTVRALDSAAVEDWRSFYLLGGMGLEHLAKARLAKEHPILIVDRGDFDSMLVLNTSHAFTPSDASQVRTVGLLEALKRCSHKRLMPSLGVLLGDLRRIADRRNSVAHVGVLDRSSSDEDLVVLLRATDILLESFPIERASYYGEFIVFVDTRMEDAASTARARAIFAITAARRRAAKIQIPIDRFDPTEEYSSIFGDANGVFIKCPACLGTAFADGLTDERDIIECINLRCLPCGLELDLEELSALGVPARCHLEEITEGRWDGLKFRKGRPTLPIE
jgi:hypothetical protein